jgi:plastocyanin
MKKFTIILIAMTLLAGMGFQATAFATTHTVQVGNYFFNPSTLNVEVGDIVKWVWVAGNHTTTSSTIPAGAASWDKLINSSNQTYSYTVTVAGTYNYVCTPHASMGMVGSFTASNPAPSLTVSPSNQNVSSAAGTTSFTVSSNTSWNASSDQSWCTVTSSGTGNGTITATYSLNSSVNTRITTITVSASGVPDQVVTVTQAGAAKTLSVTPPNQTVSAVAGTTDFTITSNTDWTVSSDASWCTVTSSGTGNGTMIATYGENTTYTERTAIITVTVAGLSPVTVQVIQGGSTVGIPDTRDISINIYPNPAKDYVNIKLGTVSENARIAMVNMLGQTVIDRRTMGDNQVTFSVGQFPRGYYFIRIYSDNELITRKVILSE